MRLPQASIIRGRQNKPGCRAGEQQATVGLAGQGKGAGLCSENEEMNSKNVRGVMTVIQLTLRLVL